jgi:hypothetical protein
MFVSQGHATPYNVINNRSVKRVLLAYGEIPVLHLSYVIKAYLAVQVQLCSLLTWH